MKKLLYFVGEDTAFLSHRLNLARAAKKEGFEVHLAAFFTTHQTEIQKKGFQVHPLKHLSRGGMNPFKDFLLLIELYFLYRALQPNIVHHVAWKPVLYGSIIARLTKVPKIINALTGMGYLYISNTVKAHVLRLIVRFALPFTLKPTNHVMIVQNPEDRDLAQNTFRIPASKVQLIRGSGVDTKKYKQVKRFLKGRLQFICVSRMLWDKGIQELVEATRVAKLTHANFDVLLCGDTDEANPSAIPPHRIHQWIRQGLVKWHGHVNDIAKAYAAAHVAVLPSYREGLPKSLLEAASCGLPIITTDVPGCREVLRENKNGFLVPAKDPRALGEAMCRMIDLGDKRKELGEVSRSMVMKHFSDEIIIGKTLRLYGAP